LVLRSSFFAGMSFDRLAPHYRWMEPVLAGDKLQRCRTAFLGNDTHFKDILIMGEGTGRFLLECRRRLETARIVCVDSSGRMLSLAKARLLNHGLSPEDIEFIQADALNWVPPRDSFDAVVTHFFLDCFQPEQLARLVGSLAQAARQKAVWLLADFQVPTAGLRRQRALLIHRAMYLFFRAVCRLPARVLTPPDEFLRAHGFALQERRITEWGLLHTDRWER
jgi:ubiquinone/menaquinone biosynthesis C-methylase UbiE